MSQLGQSIHFRPSQDIAKKIHDMAIKESVSQADIMRRALDLFFAGDAQMGTVILHTTLHDDGQLSYFLGGVHSLRELWRDVKSRLNAPRPIRPGDSVEMEEWRKQKEQIAACFSACDDTKKRLENLATLFSGLTVNDYDNLKNLGTLTLKAKSSIEERKAKERDPERIRNFDANLVYFNIVLRWLGSLGII